MPRGQRVPRHRRAAAWLGPIATTVLLAVVATGCSFFAVPEGANVSESKPPAASAETTRSAGAASESLELNPSPTAKPATTQEGGPPVGSSSSVYPDGQIDSGLQPYIDAAVADLAPRLGVDGAEIRVISAVIVTWGDTSMGCPQSGMEYLQVPQDGSIIELGWGGRVYRYHSGGNRTPFLCDQPLASPPA